MGSQLSFELAKVGSLSMRRSDIQIRQIVDNTVCFECTQLVKAWKILKMFTSESLLILDGVLFESGRLIAYDLNIGVIVSVSQQCDRSYFFPPKLFEIAQNGDGHKIVVSPGKDDQWFRVELGQTTFSATLWACKDIEEYPGLPEIPKDMAPVKVPENALKMVKALTRVKTSWVGSQSIGAENGQQYVRYGREEEIVSFDPALCKVLDYRQAWRMGTSTDVLFVQGAQATYVTQVVGDQLLRVMSAIDEIEQGENLIVAKFRKKAFTQAVRMLKITQKPKEMCWLCIGEGKIVLMNATMAQTVAADTIGLGTVSMALEFLQFAARWLSDSMTFCVKGDRAIWQSAEMIEYGCAVTWCDTALMMRQGYPRWLRVLRGEVRRVSMTRVRLFRCVPVIFKFHWQRFVWSSGEIDYTLSVSSGCVEVELARDYKVKGTDQDFEAWVGMGKKEMCRRLKEAKDVVKQAWLCEHQTKYPSCVIEKAAGGIT